MLSPRRAEHLNEVVEAVAERHERRQPANSLSLVRRAECAQQCAVATSAISSSSRDSDSFAMADLKDQYNRITRLNDFPEIARLIGIYIAHFGELELLIWHTYGIIIGLEEDDAMQLLGQIQSFSTRLEYVETFFKNRRSDMNSNSLVSEIFELTKKINMFRNKLVHGLYVTDGTKSKVYVSDRVTNPKRVPKRPVTEDTDKFFELSEGLIKAEIGKITFALQKNNDLVEVFKPHRVS